MKNIYVLIGAMIIIVGSGPAFADRGVISDSGSGHTEAGACQNAKDNADGDQPHGHITGYSACNCSYDKYGGWYKWKCTVNASWESDDHHD